MAAAVAVLVGAGLVITQLRRDAVRASAITEYLLDARQQVHSTGSLGWSLVAQGFPNFTTHAAFVAADRSAERDVEELAQRGVDVAPFRSALGVLVEEFRLEERMIAAHELADAGTEQLTGVEGTVEVMVARIELARRHFAQVEDTASARLYVGSLLALGVSAVLIAMLAAAFVLGRRRAAAAAQSALERSERRFRALVHRASEAVIVVGEDDCILDATGAVEAIFGHRSRDLIGTPVSQLASVADRGRAHQVLERMRRDGSPTGTTEWSLPRENGEPAYFEVTAADFRTDPDVAGIVLTVRDVTARHAIEAQLRYQSLHDPLTGLPNRTLFENRVGQALARLTRHEGAVAVVYIDLDGFKAVNDSLGHAAGDELLRVVAGRVDSALRGADTAARLGGDEFACLLEGLEEIGDALPIAHRLAAIIAPPVTIAGRSISPRASFGVAVTDEPLPDAEALVRDADLAMYRSKAEGRGEVVVFHEGMLNDARLRLDLREDLDRAVERAELRIAYQPLIDLETGAISGLEALVRWEHAEHGPISPDRFIPVAEETGQIVALGRWVLERAVADLADFSATAPALRMNVNVAPRELAEADYVDAVRTTLDRHGIEPHRITLEITESEFSDSGEITRRLVALSTLGIVLSIDDFGIGQSSLARLQHLPVDQVKLDRSFLSAIDQRPEQATLVRSMIELGHALGLQMVAEGIEREGQVAVLRELPCELGQGYLFGRPQGADEVRALLARGTLTGVEE